MSTTRPKFRWSGLTGIVAIACVMLMVSAVALAQNTSAPPSTPGAPAASPPPATTPATTGGTAASSTGDSSRASLKQLFLDSFDAFTVLLVIGSLAGWTIIIVCIIEVRKNNITPEEPEQIIGGLCKNQRWGDLRAFVTEDDAFVSKVVRAGLMARGDDKDSVREASELAASEECARWFRKVEPLNVIGNLGPLLGLAGTVWGMIIAFAALGQAGGQASPANLSLGVSKALFHTLLGLLLAVPCLTIYGFYRALVDKLCTRAMVISSELVEMLPGEYRLRQGDASGAARSTPNAAPRPAAPRV